MRQSHPKPYWTSVVLHVKRVASQAESFRKVVDDAGDMVEGIVELLRVGPVAVAVAGIVRRDQMVLISEARQQRLKHSRGRRQTVQQEDRRSVLAPCLAIEDVDAIYFYS